MAQTLHNYDIFNGEEILPNHSISFDNVQVLDLKASKEHPVNGYLVPGFIDLQIYGAGGRLFSADPTEESLAIIEDTLLRNGTTGFLLCLATNTTAVFDECISAVKQYRSNARNCIGLHLEGPYINPKRRGAHVSAYIRKAELDEVKKLLDFGDGVVKMMTLAPELQDDAVIQYLLDHKVIVSIGHSDASFDQAKTAFDRGIQTTTHLFNAMSPLHHREPGIPAAVFSHPTAMASIIADGVHVDFEVLKIAKRLMNDRLFLITDAVTECDEGPYQHRATKGKFELPDGTLSGSSLTMAEAIENCIKYGDISLEEAVRMATKYPSQLLGNSRLGKVEVGNSADFVILDEDLKLKQVFYKGAKI